MSVQRELLLVEGQELLGSGLVPSFLARVGEQRLLIVLGCFLMVPQRMLTCACTP